MRGEELEEAKEESGGRNVKEYADVNAGNILAERFTQVMDSIPWVRCASGNVSTTGQILPRKSSFPRYKLIT